MRRLPQSGEVQSSLVLVDRVAATPPCERSANDSRGPTGIATVERQPLWASKHGRVPVEVRTRPLSDARKDLELVRLVIQYARRDRYGTLDVIDGLAAVGLGWRSVGSGALFSSRGPAHATTSRWVGVATSRAASCHLCSFDRVGAASTISLMWRSSADSGSSVRASPADGGGVATSGVRDVGPAGAQSRPSMYSATADAGYLICLRLTRTQAGPSPFVRMFSIVLRDVPSRRATSVGVRSPSVSSIAAQWAPFWHPTRPVSLRDP